MRRLFLFALLTGVLGCLTEDFAVDDTAGGNETCDPDNENCFTCDDGSLLYDYDVCDASEDCDDGEDEVDCDYCDSDPEGCFVCDDGSGNVHGDQICDDVDQCDDGSDETTSACFECDNGRLVRPNWLCDGEDDCGDGSDEQDCT